MKRILSVLMTALVVVAICAPISYAQMGSPVQRRVRQPKDISPALQKSLTDQVSDDAFPYIDKENEKKAKGEVYTDLQEKYEYLPNYQPGGGVIASVKLGGAEYDPKDKTTSKGASTGRLRYLVFSYSLQKNKWVQIAKPKWETQDLGKAAGEKMTQHISAADKRKAAQEAAAQKRKAALNQAVQQKYGGTDQNTTESAPAKTN